MSLNEPIAKKISFSKDEWLLLIIMAAIQFCHILDFMIMMPLGPQLMRIFSIQPQQFGFLVSSYTFAAGISSFIAALVTDRFDRKTFLLIFFAGFTLSTIACSASTDYVALLIARFMAGAFGGVMGSIVLSIVSDSIAYERRGSALGIVMGAFSLASVFGVPFSLFLANRFNWHIPFLFLGAVSIGLIALVFLVFPPLKSHLIAGQPRHSPLKSISHLFHSKDQILALTFIFCLVMGQFTIIPFLAPSLVANTGMLEDQLPYLYLSGGLVSMFSSPIAGRLADAFGKKKIFSISVLLSMIPIFLITRLGHQPIALTIFIACFFFVFMSGRMVPAMAMVSATANPEYRGSFMSFVSSTQQLSAALASSVASFIVIRGNDGQILNYSNVGLVAIGFSVLAFFAARNVRPHENQKS